MLSKLNFSITALYCGGGEVKHLSNSCRLPTGEPEMEHVRQLTEISLYQVAERYSHKMKAPLGTQSSEISIPVKLNIDSGND
jgi:hypothetical protein